MSAYIDNSVKERMLSIALLDVTNHFQSLYISDIWDVLVGRMDLELEEIEGVQSQGPSPKSFEILIASEQIWLDKNVDTYIGRKFSLGFGGSVTIERPYEQLTQVIVKRVPMCWTRDFLQKIFS